MNPFSKNIVFVDTEFSTLNPYEGEILSVGIVKLTGEELYLELEYGGECSEWVRQNILPTLTGIKTSRDKAKKLISDFVGKNQPYAVSYVNQFDTIYLYKLFVKNSHPFYWLPIDFASILFANNMNPENYLNLAGELKIDVGKYKLHNALDDARLLREIYLKLYADNKQ